MGIFTFTNTFYADRIFTFTTTFYIHILHFSFPNISWQVFYKNYSIPLLSARFPVPFPCIIVLRNVCLHYNHPLEYLSKWGHLIRRITKKREICIIILRSYLSLSFFVESILIYLFSQWWSYFTGLFFLGKLVCFAQS